MKRYLEFALMALEFALMALGIPGVYLSIALIALGLVLALFCGCTDGGSWVMHKDGNYGPAWWDDKANVEKASESAPETLKPYYDADLTRKLNQNSQ